MSGKRELVSSEWLDARIAERAALEHKLAEITAENAELREYCDQRTIDQGNLATELAEVTSERDYLRERLRELMAEWEIRAAMLRGLRSLPEDAHAAGVDEARKALARIVTDSETGGNETATQGGQDAPTPEGTT